MNAELAPLAPATRWRPAPVTAGSMALHCVAGVSAFFGPEVWPWTLAALVANHAVLGFLCLRPRSTWLGPNLTRLPASSAHRGEIALTFDDGPDPTVTPKVLDLLEERGARATFFCIGGNAILYPDICREIAHRGHGVENHSRSHLPTFALLGPGGIRKEIAAAQATLAELSGRAPRFFRAPAGFRNPFLDPVLHALGLQLVSWTRRGFDTRRSNVESVTARLLGGIGAGDILLLHDGHAARSASGAPVVLEVLPRVLDAVEALHLRPVTLHQAVDP